MMSDEELNQLKEVEYYSQSLNARDNSAMELDKSLLTLSAAGLGVLVSLMISTGVTSFEVFLLYIFAFLSFLVCLFSVLRIFEQNKAYIDNDLKGKAKDDPFLAILDSIAVGSFFIAIIFSFIIGISTAYHSYTEKDKKMATENLKTTAPIATNSVNRSDECNLEKSYNGRANICVQM